MRLGLSEVKGNGDRRANLFSKMKRIGRRGEVGRGTETKGGQKMIARQKKELFRMRRCKTEGKEKDIGDE